MKTIIKYLFVPLLIFSGTSCGDFLDQKPKEFLESSDINSIDELNQALTGTYRSLIASRTNLDPLIMDFMCDNGVSDQPDDFAVWNGSHTATSGGVAEGKWIRDYEGILRANTVLYYAPLLQDASEEQCNQIIAEARFLRALFYADLIQNFGAVPYRTEPEGVDKKISPRVDEKEILGHIMEDLEFAEEHLPVSYPAAEFGRATKGAAIAFQARYYLFYHMYDKCVEACRKVMDLGVYDLHPSYKELFTPAVEQTNKEYIFQDIFIAGADLQGLSGCFWTMLSAIGSKMVSHNLTEEYYMKANGLRYDAPGSGYSNRTPYEGRDPRLLFNIKVNQEYKYGEVRTGYKVQKFVDDDANPQLIHRNDEVDYPLMRYADVLLMLAEASLESGNYNYDEVVGLVDRIRQRGDVMMPTVAQAEGLNGMLSTDELRQVIRHERRVEFPFEGLRFADIRRWKIGAEAFSDCYAVRKITNEDDPNNPYVYYKKELYLSRTFNEAKGYLWPIPAIEIQTNPMENNPGYE